MPIDASMLQRWCLLAIGVGTELATWFLIFFAGAKLN